MPRPGDHSKPTPSLTTVAHQWTRLGVTGFGGPPTHITLLRTLCVTEQGWLDAEEFEDAIATTNLLPGPASTQLAIYCAWRLRGARGAIVGGLCFIAPELILIVALAAVLLAHHPPVWFLGAAAGAGAAVPAVALHAASTLALPSLARVGVRRGARSRWFVYGAIGAATTIVAGQFVVLALVGCGVVELTIRSTSSARAAFAPLGLTHAGTVGGLGALAWVALKVGALSYGGGFVIVPLMQHDVVTTYHWMSGTQFLGAVALGQITPGPVVQTIAVVGYAAGGIGGALLAALIAFAPSFVFVLVGARHFGSIRNNVTAQSFLNGAGPCVIGAIAGSSVALTRTFAHPWQAVVLSAALVWLFALRRGVVAGLLLCAGAGLVVSLAGVRV
jgi:chromate transporter